MPVPVSQTIFVLPAPAGSFYFIIADLQKEID